MLVAIVAAVDLFGPGLTLILAGLAGWAAFVLARHVGRGLQRPAGAALVLAFGVAFLTVAAAEIEIPFPQCDIPIRSMPRQDHGEARNA
jgi:hypothetical protein